MSSESPISMPWSVRWRYYRHGLLPAVCFISSLIAVWLLWRHQENTRRIIGEVTAVRVDVTSPFNGFVVDLPRNPDGQWSMLDTVSKGDVVALVQRTLLPLGSSPGSETLDESPESILAPIDGCVLQIHCVPGQSTTAFQPIMTISGEQARFILAYVPDSILGKPKQGSSVVVSSRTGEIGSVSCIIERVGLSIEPIPRHLMPGAIDPQLGLPIRIKLPLGIVLRPGSLLDVTLPPSP